VIPPTKARKDESKLLSKRDRRLSAREEKKGRKEETTEKQLDRKTGRRLVERRTKRDTNKTGIQTLGA
jgi:hypothetical protein